MFQAPSYISKITTMADKSLRIQVDTQELNAESMTAIFGLYDKYGWFIFKESEITQEDIDVPDYVPEFQDDKTPAKRLRAVIYLSWEQEGKKDLFDDYYKRKMEQVIEHFKSKLE